MRNAIKTRTFAYWMTTGLLVFCMTGGVFELLGFQTTVDGITRLGYPAYILPVLGLGKVLAVLAILWPGFPRLKEWAYAGIFFNMLGAVVSHVGHHDPAWTLVVTLTIAGPLAPSAVVCVTSTPALVACRSDRSALTTPRPV